MLKTQELETDRGLDYNPLLVSSLVAAEEHKWVVLRFCVVFGF